MTISNPKFDFDCLLQEAIGHEDSGDHDHDCTDEEEEDKGGQFGQFEPQEYRKPQRTESQPSLSSKDHGCARKKVQSHTHRSKQR